MDLGALMVRIEGDAKPLGRSLDEAQKGIGQFSQSATRQFGGMAGQFSRLFTDVVEGDLKGLTSSLFSLLQSISRASGAPSSLAGLIGDGGSLISGIAGLFSKGRAMGGAVQGGQAVLVGENGPEIFTPHGNGSVTPNHAIGKANAITLNMTVVTPDAQSFRASQGQILAEAAQSLARAGRFS